MVCGNVTSRCRVIDYAFSEPRPDLVAVQFNNKHSYSVSLLAQSRLFSGWKVLLWNYLLMDDPHTSGKATENWVTLLNESFLHKVGDVTRLRLLLRQPSPHWAEFGIENFSVGIKTHSTQATPLGHSHHCKGLDYEVNLLTQ